MKPNEENMPLLTRKQNSHETVYRFCQKRISPYPARPAYHADTDRHADCTDYTFRLCHLDRSAQCTDCHPCTFPPDGYTESDGATGCQRVFHGEICRSVSDEIERLFRRNLIELAVVFPSDLHRLRFDSEEIQILADATDPNLAVTRSTYAQTILKQAMQTLRQTTTTSAYSQSDKQPVMVYNKLLYNPQMKSAYNFVPGVMGLILMLICAMMTSISIVREKETGTMEVLLVSPVNPLFIILSKAVPYFVLSLLNLTTILLLSVFVLDVPIAGSLPALLGVSLLFIFVSLALGLLISCITHTQVAALLVSAMVLMIPTIILSGIIFPIESMPGILQVLSCLIPARWYVETVRRLMIEGVPLVYVWKEVTVMCLMAVVLITATARKFKNRLE